MRLRTLGVACALGLAATAPLPSQSAGLLALPAFLGAAETPAPPPRLAPRLLRAPLAALPAAADAARDELAAVLRWNAFGGRPARNGFARRLPAAQMVRLSRATAEGAWQGGAAMRRGDGGIVWGTRVDVLGAYRLRLHLTDVRLPAGARMWVYGAAETRGPFGGELAGPAGDLWTPSVGGGSLWLEVEIPAAALASGASFGFTLPAVLEILPMGAGAPGTISPRVDTTCLVDGSCVQPAAFAPIAQYRAAVASLDFVIDGLAGFFCTGTLLNDSRSSGIPYLLTADHCIASQETASTVEAVWDDYDATCNGPSPDRSALPVSEGATLLAAGLASDFSLLRLHAVPPGRVLLGWNADAAAVAPGTPLFRLSHPFPGLTLFAQRFSSSVATRNARPCPIDAGGRPLDDLTKFIHSVPVVGATFEGSSGSAVVLGNGQVVGQLWGVCPASTELCLAGSASDQTDGAFAATYPAVAAWLDPPASAGPCVPGDTTLCIDDAPGDRRFRVEVTFQQKGAAPLPGHAIPLAGLGVSSGGVFWFFDAANPELLVKVLNGCSLGNHYWVFSAAGTDVGLTTTVTDTVTGAHKTYTNPIGTAAPPVQDTSALPCN